MERFWDYVQTRIPGAADWDAKAFRDSVFCRVFVIATIFCAPFQRGVSRTKIGHMTRPQRIVAVLYCLLLAYCCAWIPWHVTYVVESQSSVGDESTPPFQGEKIIRSRTVYSFIWNAPSDERTLRWIPTPAIDLILLRIVAASAVCSAAFFLVGLWKSATLS